MLHCIQNVTLPNMFHLAKKRQFAKNITVPKKEWSMKLQ